MLHRVRGFGFGVSMVVQIKGRCECGASALGFLSTGMAADRVRKDLEELESKFDSKLRLTEKEREGITIDRKVVEGVLLGFQCTLVAEVFTSKDMHGKAFIDCFTSFWRRREGVSIRDLGNRRFLARIVGHGDLRKGMEADQPWTFKSDLVLVADRTGTGFNRWASFSLGIFWVQIHNVLPLSMIAAVVESIGGRMGCMQKVDTSVSRDYIGRFLRVKICFNVCEPLMRGTFVNFPDDGKVWVDFKYEALLKYCVICGVIGHATRVCKEFLDAKRADSTVAGNLDDNLVYRGLVAETDLWGNLL